MLGNVLSVSGTERKESRMTITKLMAACIVLSLVGVPVVSFAKARGGSGGGYFGGSRGGSPSGSIGSRGSRTYDQNGAQPIQQSSRSRPRHRRNHRRRTRLPLPNRCLPRNRLFYSAVRS